MQAGTSQEPVVSLRRLGKTYEPTPTWMRLLVRRSITAPIAALSDVTLDIHAGEILSVVGPNGAGKTTLFKILVGLTTPSTGRANVLGHDAHRQSEHVRRFVGWMPAEDRSLFLRMTCRENLYFHGRLQGLSRRALQPRIREVLSQVGLENRTESAAQSLSAGMRARLQLARAILHMPRLLILDEPTAAVDPVAAHRLLGLITNLVNEHRMAALISSHRLEEIQALHSNVVLLDEGRVRYVGDLDVLREQYQRAQVDLTFTSLETSRRGWEVLCRKAGADDVQHREETVRYTLRHDETVGEVLASLAGLVQAVVQVQQVELPLRDLLMRIYTEGKAPVNLVETA